MEDLNEGRTDVDRQMNRVGVWDSLGLAEGKQGLEKGLPRVAPRG